MLKPLLLFQLDGFPKDMFHVLRFFGTEAFSQLSRFEVLLVTEMDPPELEQMLRSQARLSIRREDTLQIFSGVVESAEYLHQFGRFRYYRMELASSLQRLELVKNNQVFLDCSLDKLVASLLTDAGLKQNSDFSLQLEQTYDTHEFVCQFNESAFAFLTRRLEQHGAVFFFDQISGREQCVITDAAVFQEIPGGPLEYLPRSGMESGERVIRNFGKRLKSVAGKVRVRDCNYRLAPYDLTAEEVVQGYGQQAHPAELHVFAPNVKTEKECRRRAQTASRRLAYEHSHFAGAGACPSFRPGRTFTLRGHYTSAYNQKYLITSVRHTGHQEGYLEQELGVHPLKDRPAQEKVLYENAFTASPDGAPYLPARQSSRPAVHGYISATIDGSGSGEYAEMDGQGRYKVILPLDLSGRKDGKASAWIRMNQPYAGDGHGMHLPLHKGCEVALMFLGGDPDRPVIAGALSNGSNSSPVTEQNATHNILSTGHKNLLQLEDQKNAGSLLFQNNGGKNFIRLGNPLPETKQPKEQKKTVNIPGKVKHKSPFKTFFEDHFKFDPDGSQSDGVYGMELKILNTDFYAGSALSSILGEQSKTNAVEKFGMYYGPMDYSIGKLTLVRVLAALATQGPQLGLTMYHLDKNAGKKQTKAEANDVGNMFAALAAGVMPAQLTFEISLMLKCALLRKKELHKATNKVFAIEQLVSPKTEESAKQEKKLGLIEKRYAKVCKKLEKKKKQLVLKQKELNDLRNEVYKNADMAIFTYKTEVKKLSSCKRKCGKCKA